MKLLIAVAPDSAAASRPRSALLIPRSATMYGER